MGLCYSHGEQYRNTGVISEVRYRRKKEAFEKDGQVLCKVCDQWKLPSDYYAVDGTINEYTCKECVCLRKRASTYSISVDKLEKMLHDGCTVCQSHHRLAIDHDHKCCDGPYSCGKCVRGVLCNACNTALGLLGESTTRINRLRDYLMSGGQPLTVVSYAEAVASEGIEYEELGNGMGCVSGVCGS